MLTRNGFQNRQKSRKSAFENANSANNSSYSRKSAGITGDLVDNGGVNNPSTLALVDRVRMKRAGDCLDLMGFGFRGMSDEELTEGWSDRPEAGYNSGHNRKCPAVLVTPRTRHGKD